VVWTSIKQRAWGDDVLKEDVFEIGSHPSKAALKLYCQKPECIEPHFSSIFCLAYSELSRQLLGEGWILPAYHPISRQFRHLGVENPADARNDLDITAAFAASFNIDIKYAFQSSPHGAYFWCAQVIAA
jgi:hypothetical protein